MADDRTLWVAKDGTITLRIENDGWAYMRRGAEAIEQVITAEELRLRYPNLYEHYQRGPTHTTGPVYWSRT